MTARVLGFVLGLSCAVAAHAANVAFSLPPSVKAGAVTLSLQRIDEVEDLAKAASIKREVDLAQPLPPIELAPGHWSVHVGGEGVWHERQFFTIGEDSEIALNVVRAAFVTATLPVPADVTMQFEREFRDGEAVCSTREKTLRCIVPEGVLHLRAKAPGRVAEYFHDVRLEAGATRDLGALKLREGQSISGRIELPRGVRIDPRRIEVHAEPAKLFEHRTLGQSLLPVRGIVEKNGVFHVDGVTQGAWLLHAKAPSLASARVEVPVRETGETRLIEPLQLMPPQRVRLSLDPPASPAGDPWHVELTQMSGPRHLDTVTSDSAEDDGTWTSAPLPAGQYELVVSQAGATWHTERLALDGGDANLRIALAARLAKGRVTIGEKPLRASLTFRSRGRTAQTDSDEKGHFSVVLPDRDAKSWDVQVDSETPLVARDIKNVPLSDSGEIEVELGPGVLRGEVVDEDGKPVPFALIRLFDEDRHMGDPSANEGGTFAIHGIRAGRHHIAASGPYFMESDTVEVEIGKDGKTEDLHLVLKKPKFVKGRVLSPLGPVADASVYVRSTDVPMFNVTRFRTDANGFFSAPLLRDANEFDISVEAAGFAYTMDHVRYRPSQLIVKVVPNGGMLTVRTESKGIVQVVHGGAILNADYIASVMKGRVADGEIIMPMLEPGPYSACYVPLEKMPQFRATNGASGGRCVSGVLAPSGTLTLQLGKDML